jgi:hypothetical protein
MEVELARLKKEVRDDDRFQDATPEDDVDRVPDAKPN